MEPISYFEIRTKRLTIKSQVLKTESRDIIKALDKESVLKKKQLNNHHYTRKRDDLKLNAKIL